MLPSSLVHTARYVLAKFVRSKINEGLFCRGYAKKQDDGCCKAYVDMPPEVDPVYPVTCERGKKKTGILHKIKLRVVEGGTNFGTPFRRVKCQKKVCKEEEVPEPVALLSPERQVSPMTESRAGVQVSIFGADTPVGQYIALLLKQCPCIKKLRLYEAKDSQCNSCTRDLYKVVEDLKHIDTNCLVQAYSCACHELERCLQNTDIVLMLDSGYINIDMPFEKRFCYQAPMVKKYADAIANECPKAFVIVCASPIDCMVPLIAEHNVEMMTETVRDAPLSVSRSDGDCVRAAELSEAHALAGLVTKVAWAQLCKDVPRVSGFVETDASQVISPARFIANTVEICGTGISKNLGLPKMSEVETTFLKLALNELSLKTEMVHDWYCKFCSSTNRLDTYQTRFFTPRTYERYLGIEVLLNDKGICKKYDVPKLSPLEVELLDIGLSAVTDNVCLALHWYQEYMMAESTCTQSAMRKHFLVQKHYDRIDDCTMQLT